MPPEGSLSGSIAADGASRGSDLFRPDYQRLCTALLAAGRGIEAVEMLRGAVADHPDDPALRNRLAVLLKREGRLAEAIPVLRDGIARFPENARAHSELLDILHRLGRHAEAVPVAVSAQRARPLDFDLQTRIIAALAHRPAAGAAVPEAAGPQEAFAATTIDLVAPDMLGALLHGGQAKPGPPASRRARYAAVGVTGIVLVAIGLALRHPAPVQVASFTPEQTARPTPRPAAAPLPVQVPRMQPLGPPVRLAAAPPPTRRLVVQAPGPLLVQPVFMPVPVQVTGTLPIGPLVRLATAPRAALPKLVQAPAPLMAPPVDVASIADTSGRATDWTPGGSESAPPAIRIVYPRGDEAAARALAASLRDAASTTLQPAEPGRGAPGISYFFAQDAASASALQRRLGRSVGPVRWARGESLPSPGVIELTLRGTAGRP